jgi:hypothetical protein
VRDVLYLCFISEVGCQLVVTPMTMRDYDILKAGGAVAKENPQATAAALTA